jgi:hypothetical protein
LGNERGYLDGMGKRLERAAAPARRWLAVGSRSVLLTGLLLAFITWPIAIRDPATGLDNSWMSALYMAIHQGKHFGSEVVFTYGPAGFLAWPQLWFSWLAVLAWIYSGLIYVAFAMTLTWMLSRTVGLLVAALVTWLFISTNVFVEELPLFLAVGWSFAAMRADRPRAAVTLLVVGGGLLCGIEPLVKLSVGPPIVLVTLLGLFGARVSRRQWGTFAAVAIGSFLAAWFLLGQGLGNLWDYTTNGAQVIAGYNEAMGFDAGNTWELVAIVIFAIGLVALVNRANFRDARARWLATALTAVAAYVVFKYGTTQFSAGGPPAIALSTLLAIFLMLPWLRQRAALFLTASAVLGAIVLYSYPAPAKLDPITNLKIFGEAAELAVRPGLRQQHIDEGRASMQATFAMTPHVKSVIEGKGIAVEPWETGIVWAYELDWSPFPAFQTYVAYTSDLDRLNAASIEDPDGPQVLLRPIPAGIVPLGGRPGFAGRQPLWDPPEQNVVTVCNFVPTLTEGPWQVLSRIPDRCRPQKLISSHSGEPGETVPIPQAGRNELVILRLGGAGVEGLEKLASLVWRPNERWVRLDGERYGYRLVPGTAGDGLIVSADRTLDRNVDFAEFPAVHDIRVEGADGPLQFDFYRIKLKPIRLVPAPRSGGGAVGG